MNYFKYIIILVIIFILTIQCNPHFLNSYITKEDIQFLEASDEKRSNQFCRNYESYIPDKNHLKHFPRKTLRLNFHFMRNAEGKENFSEAEGREFAKKMIKSANFALWQNNKMHLPEGNNTPVITAKYKFILHSDLNPDIEESIYFHDDPDLYYFVKTGKDRNNFKRDVYKKYGKHTEEAINIFIMPHHPDSIASPSYKPTHTGIAFPSDGWAKLCGCYYQTKYKNKSHYHCAKLLNHEVGHILGLRHTWGGNDGCDDTPNNPNCWSTNPNQPPCDGVVSNNLMDYNHSQNAWTPCQIGIVHKNLSNKKHFTRKYIEKKWCENDPNQLIEIDKNIIWSGSRDLHGGIVILPGGSLTLQCRVHLPKDARITVKAGGTLILDGCTIENDCGDKWKGIVVQQIRKSKGKIIFKNNPTIKDVLNPVEIPGS